ncbi:MAG TPA: 16S rRNA (cytosine(1402)-N(4))-methyltransferase RsmH [Flavisolibacter sp.]|nr:16S rRNA (cytosine(1402)-N(4))-methyltransferase RsmH [Flavisolibacter sp.]
MTGDKSYHIPVLFKEVLDFLVLNKDGIYVDCTFGGGGHSKGILQQLSDKGKLIAFDQDADVLQNIPKDDRILFIPHNFRHLSRFLRLNGVDKVDGILADLGVSSHQFDEAARGFSIRFSGKLDMRMDQRQDKTAAHIINSYSEARLHKLFEQYGEVTNSKTLARTIIESRKTISIDTIETFRNVIKSIIKGNPNKYLAQVFQALRMEVNDEMNALKELLEQSPEVLKIGGRIAVITFHSIEDRIVKRYFRDNTFSEEEENPFESKEKERILNPVNKKPVTASEKEIKINPRSRSAKLRVAERI